MTSRKKELQALDRVQKTLEQLTAKAGESANEYARCESEQDVLDVLGIENATTLDAAIAAVRADLTYVSEDARSADLCALLRAQRHIRNSPEILGRKNRLRGARIFACGVASM